MKIAAASRIVVKAGEQMYLNAHLISWMPTAGCKKEPGLVYIIKTGEGRVSKDGVFTAPLLKKDSITEILVKTKDDSVEKILKISVQATKPVELSPRVSSTIAGEEIRFRASSKFGIRPIFIIVSPDPSKGSIDSETGLYQAPAKIAKEIKVTVRAVDQDHPTKKEGYSDEVEFKLRPVVMKEEGGGKLVISAGRDKFELPIVSENDRAGDKNFSCRIIEPRPAIGRIEDGGIYWPPFSVKAPTTVKVEATSKSDTSKKVVLEFTVS